MVEERRKQEVSIVKKYNFMSIKQLASELDVSEMTIRRDVAVLTEHHLLKQVFGGVIPSEQVEDEQKYTIDQELSRNKDQKQRIVEKAVSFIHPDDVVFFDSGTTVQLLSEQLPKDFSLVGIASCMNTLSVLTKLDRSTIITPGGVFSHKPGVFYDQEALKSIRRYRANVAFLGATGYELQMGLTCGYIEDAPLKQAMMESSKEKILLLDSSKFGIVSTCSFAKISDFSLVITDSGIPEEYAEQIRSSNVELMIV